MLRGKKVYPQVVSILLLSCDTTILAQHDTIAALNKRVMALQQHGIVCSQARIQALENWVLKQDELINLVNSKLCSINVNGVIVIVNENKEIESLKKKR